MICIIGLAMVGSSALASPPRQKQRPRIVKVVAPLIKSFTMDDPSIFVRGHEIKIHKYTRFRDYDKTDFPRYIMVPDGEGRDRDRDVVPGFTMEQGQWLSIQAKYDTSGMLIADKITKIKANVLQFSEFTKKDFIKDSAGRNQLHPFKLLMEDNSGSPGLSYRLSRNILAGGTLELENRWEDDRDLDRTKKKDKQYQLSVLKLAAAWRFGKADFMLIEPAYQFNQVSSQDDSRTIDKVTRLARGYIYKEFGAFMAVHAGRMNFDDEREWLYDNVLDAVRLYFFKGPWLFDISTGGGREEWDKKNDTQNIDNKFADLRYYFAQRHFVSLWTMQREDKNNPGDRIRLAGGRYYLRQSSGWNGWLEIAEAGGASKGETIDGTAFDFGLAFKSKIYPKQYYFFDLAYGSGPVSESQPGSFRQSGLQGNSAKFGGVTSYKYYGEVMRPELSNLMIATIGIGMRSMKLFSMDFVHHEYRQAEPTKYLVDNKIKANPNGESTDLGNGFDIIFGYRTKKIKVEMITGAFFPGEAFTQKDTAYRTEFSLDFKF